MRSVLTKPSAGVTVATVEGMTGAVEGTDDAGKSLSTCACALS